MISRAIFTSFVLLAVYNIFVVWLAPEWWTSTQSYLQDNLARAQNLDYDERKTIQSIIVGSSLSRNIITDSLPYTYNLAFVGKGVLDGLNILDKTSKIPKNIFIETNYIVKPPSSEFTDLINNPVMYYPRKYLLSLREDKQPIVIFGLMQIKAYVKIKSIILKKNEPIEIAKNKKDEISPIFEQHIKIRTKDYSEIPKASEVEKSLRDLKYYINRFEKKGSNIIFIEMPIAPQLNGLPKAKFMRNLMKSNFPVSKYKYLVLPDSVTFQTNDGIHLGKNEALRYTMYFKSEVEKLLSR